ncbi:Bcr/CflA family efflux MFS transporter [Rickettsia bellii]|uniref:Bcr/CflA family efflux transporter n=1 Tax=Rickettsia bellii str. RML Mogi TaxID=1359194 RepID=A0A0F3QHH2_RICBE|nr:Bcr/CflA family efflux MFS transporter [Rickettsia bellii]KJV91576.1 drug resistance transporter, Bcr/CflA subfamily protein [Rickettsia bellii str. RML Mogi]
MKIIAKIPAWMLLCLFTLSPITETIYTSGLPSITEYFNTDGSTTQITSSLYYLGFALGILTLGRLSDIYGRRPVVLFGLCIYAISSIISIFAPNIETLMLARFVQAFGVSVGSVIGQAMARDSYQGSELSYVYASLSPWLLFIPSLGSSIGGYIIEYSSWHYTFVFFSLTGTVLLTLYCKILPETNPYINFSQTSKYFEVLKVVIRDKSLWLYAFIIGAFNGIYYGFYIEAPFIFIDKMKVAPSFYGKLAFLLSFAGIFGGFLGGYLIKKRHIHDQKVMILGLVFSVIGCSLLAIDALILQDKEVGQNIAVIMIFAPMMLHMVGNNLLIPMTLRYALEDYAKVTGTAGSVFGAIYYVLIAAVTFLVSKLHSDTIGNFALLFLVLSVSSAAAFYYILILYKKKLT